MSEVNASIVVQPITATIIVDNNNINFTPTVTDLSIFTGATSYSITQLDADISNVHISGGVNGYVLETDGLGNLSWTAQTSGTGTGIPGGSNTQIQFNDAGDFGGNSGFTFDKTTGNVAAANFVGNLSGTATTASYSWHAFVADSANSVAVGNVGGLGNVALLNKDGNSGNVLHGDGSWSAALSLNGDAGNLSNINGANVTGFVANANHANLATYATTANAVAGANVSGYVANANYAAYAGNVTLAAQSNITSVGRLTALTVGNATSNTRFTDGTISTDGNIYTTGISGNISGANVISANSFIGNISGDGNVTSLTVTGVSTLGSVSNVKITGGSSGQYLKTDGTGNLSWGAVSSSSISNGTSNVNVVSSGGAVNVAVGGSNVGVFSSAGLGVTGTVASGKFTSNIATGTAPFTVTSTTTVANLHVANATYATNAGSSATANNVSNASASMLVNDISAYQFINPVANNSGSLGYTGQRWANLFVGNVYTSNVNFTGTVSSNLIPASASSTTTTHKIPIELNGVTYYIMLTDTP